MPSLSETLAALAHLRPRDPAAEAASGRLDRLTVEGTNPGELKAKVHVPAGLAKGSPLVVVLHGCTQNAAGYDAGSGWSEMADRHGFAVLFPEQRRRNNPNLCFNWFVPGDTRRDGGEALSIRQMIATMVERHAIDPARIFVTGLSAGGAMASVMLATYPELFAGGAIIAGVPYATAASVGQALERMRGQGLPGDTELAALVRKASDHRGRWPTLSVWQGTADTTVAPANAMAIVGQWRALQGLDARPDRTETVDGCPRQVWLDRDGREAIESFSIAGMGHGTPLATRGPDGLGVAGPHLLEAGISSTRHICAFWGIATAGSHVGVAAPPARKPERIAPAAPAGIGKIIEDALRSAGLMR